MADEATVGIIVGTSEWDPVVDDAWIELIDRHASLMQVPSTTGINPFTRRPMEIHAPRSTALVIVDGLRVGSIGCAADGSPFLVVTTTDEWRLEVIRVATQVATMLGASFAPEPN